MDPIIQIIRELENDEEPPMTTIDGDDQKGNSSDVRKLKDRDRKRNMTDEAKLRARLRAESRRTNITPDELNARREKDRERKRLKLLDTEYRRELKKKVKERQSGLDKDSLDKIREKDRIRKRAEYRLRAAGPQVVDAPPHGRTDSDTNKLQDALLALRDNKK